MLKITFDAEKFRRQLTDIERQHFPFAVSRALNLTALDRQAAFRQRIKTSLTIRNAGAQTLFHQAVRFGREDYSNKSTGKFTATVRILGRDTPAELQGFRRIGQMILRQDEGGTKTSDALVRVGKRMEHAGFILPAKGLRTLSRGVPQRLYPKSIGVMSRRDVDGRLVFAKSKRRGSRKRPHGESFYAVPNVGIFMRRHSGWGVGDSDPIWFFRKSITLPARLGLDKVFHAELPSRLAHNFRRSMDDALRTAR